MRIAIDATPLMKPQRTGVARYALSLVRALSEVGGDEEEFLLCYRLSRWSRRRHRIRPPSLRFTSRWIQGPLHPRGVQLAHGPGGRLLRWRGARAVATVHDVFSLVSEEFASPSFRAKRARHYAEIAEKADLILCVSSWTRDSFWEHHRHVSEDRFLVIPEGVEERFTPSARKRLGPVRAKYSLPPSYVLYVGELSSRKNIAGMLDAYEIMPADAPPLILAGKTAHGAGKLGAELVRRALERRILPTGYFPDEDLPALYAGAECFLFPSFLEGFGLPVLEAMACGTPVVTSDRGALPETAGGVRVSVDPTDPESIKDGVMRVLWDSDLKEDLVRRGVEWSKLYTWSKVARRTLQAYREVLR